MDMDGICHDREICRAWNDTENRWIWMEFVMIAKFVVHGMIQKIDGYGWNLS